MFEEDEELFSEAKLEGFYSTWTRYATRNLQQAVNAAVYPNVMIDEIAGVYYVAYANPAGLYRFEVYNLYTGALIFSSPALLSYQGNYGPLPNIQFSPLTQMLGYGVSLSRYLALTRFNLTDVEIWKNGVLLDTIDLVPLGFSDPFLVFSLSGKWLFMTFLGTQAYLIYEGA